MCSHEWGHEWGHEGDLGDWHVRRFARCEWGGWT